MRDAAGARHAILHKDPFAYCAHPHVIRGNEGLVSVFNWAPRKSFVMHPPQEPLFHNLIFRSVDEGHTWSSPEVVPDYGWSGTETAGLTRLIDGRLMLTQWRTAWHPLGLAKARHPDAGCAFPDRLIGRWRASAEHERETMEECDPEAIAPWARCGGVAWVHFSEDDGRSFMVGSRIETAPLSGGYGMRGALELSPGHLLLPLSDVPNYRTVFTVESRDGGANWSSPRIVASLPGSEFEEPTIIMVPSGRIIMVLRDNGTRRLHQVISIDRGQSWTAPMPLPIEGYPAHLLLLRDGRLLMTYGWRYPDFGVRAVLSRDEGASWDLDDTIRVRGGLPNKNLGYPSTIMLENDDLFTVYYGEDSDGVTCIMSTQWHM